MRAIALLALGAMLTPASVGLAAHTDDYGFPVSWRSGGNSFSRAAYCPPQTVRAPSVATPVVRSVTPAPVVVATPVVTTPVRSVVITTAKPAPVAATTEAKAEAKTAAPAKATVTPKTAAKPVSNPRS